MSGLALLMILAPAAPGGGTPAVLQRVAAECPAWARGAGLSTRVALRVLVGADGSPRRVEVVPYTVRDDILTRRMRASFDSAAVRAVRRWSFRPATRAGRPVAAWLAVEVPFVEPGSRADGTHEEMPDSIRSPQLWDALMGEWWRARIARGPDRRTPAGRASAIAFYRDGRFVELDARGRERMGRFEMTAGGGPGETTARLTRRWSWASGRRAVDALRFAGRDTLILCPLPGGAPCDTFIATARGNRP